MEFKMNRMMEQLPEQYFAKLVGKVNQLKQQGADLINLGQGNPDQPTPEHIVKSLQEGANNPNFHKYSPFRGYGFLKEAVASYYKREFNVDIDPEQEVCILFGGKGGLIEISQCLLNPGDVALVPDPGYPDYWSGVALAGGKMEMMPLKAEHDFLPDYEAIPQNIVKQAKLLFLNYPNNPTGATAPLAFYDDTVSFAEKNKLCVVSDFAYGAIGFDKKKPVSFLQAEGAKDVGIEIYTLSKTFNMAGWRVGFAVGNQSVIEMLNVLQDHLYVSLFGAIQQAAATALLESQDCVDQLVTLYEKRKNHLISGLQSIGWDVKAPQGSFFSWLPCPNGMTSDEFADLLLQKAHIAVAPGRGFGQWGEGYVRVALLEDLERLEEVVARIDKLKLF
ncbi:pyridoxal phosphate-dependent aminotransferase [Alkalihalobacillus sp. LMS39]|uniref:pyridoxal phosphate-dependent aminotransferase n=1 Tax=Alkalihalobacillus sp. LMS39 TaxID=2924032 RepID=UPI001FB2D5C5|nr:pyridoxal phosphate-dependent aminotransferase [Alkalihalobacillus sp. LMS39]UOE94335.1 pyridoxal phosphate-dependent aminotransferase [Alkalihalobacillus sp. LMS39]